MKKINVFKVLAIILVITLIPVNFFDVVATSAENKLLATNDITQLDSTPAIKYSSDEFEKNNIETNVFESQIDKNAAYGMGELTLGNLPDYVLEAVGINKITGSGAPVGLDDADANQLTSFTTVNGDGTNTLYLFNEPIKYVDKSTNEIKFIDNSIVPKSVITETITPINENSLNTEKVGAISSGFKNAANSISVDMPHSVDQGVTLEYGDIEVSLIPAATSSSTAALKNIAFRGTTEQVVEYADVFGSGIHLQYVPINSGIKENIVLDRYTGVNTFNFIVDTGVYYPMYMEGEAIPFADPATDKIVFTLGQVDARDSYVGEESDGHFTLYNSLSLTEIKDGIYTLTVTVDPDFLASETTVYPVVIDPTVTVTSGNMQDTTVYSGHPDKQTYYSSAYNVVGYHGSTAGTGTAFIQTTNMSDYSYILPGNVTNATYRVYEGSGKTNSVRVRVGSPRYSWNQNTITYNNKSRIDPISFLTISSSGWKNFDITTVVKYWLGRIDSYDGIAPETGFTLEALDSSSSSLHFCSANNSSYAPSISITYRNSAYTIDVDATFNSTNDVAFKAMGYLIHGISPEFKFKISTPGTYIFQTLNSDTQFDYYFSGQDTRLELLDSSYSRVDYNDNINSTNLYSKISVSLSAGTYYLRIYNSSGTRTNIRCYLIAEKSGELYREYSVYANLAKEFYKIANATETYNCLAYVLRIRTQTITLSTNEIEAVNKLLSYDKCKQISEPTNSCIVLYGLKSIGSTHVCIVENGVVKSKMGDLERVKHASIDPYYVTQGYGVPIRYFTDPNA